MHCGAPSNGPLWPELHEARVGLRVAHLERYVADIEIRFTTDREWRAT
jgi:hypothetical protein